MQLWDQFKREQLDIIIVGSTNRPQDLDPAILRRFERSFLVDIPSPTERKEILETAFAAYPKDPNFNYDLCVELTQGYYSSDIRGLCDDIIITLQMEALTTQLHNENENNNNINNVNNTLNSNSSSTSSTISSSSSAVNIRPLCTSVGYPSSFLIPIYIY
jgi:SpoVK/Ycf46/Vps4 family AAA+-type ATPase